MHSSGFVVAVMVNGKVAPEKQNGQVLLPFGTEFQVYLKNKNSRTAVAQIFLDGENVSGGGYVLRPRTCVTIERYLEIPKRFKFVSLESDEAVLEGKNGDNSEGTKGLVEVRFFYEKIATPPIQITEVHNHYYTPPVTLPYVHVYPRPSYGILRGFSTTGLADTSTNTAEPSTVVGCMAVGTQIMSAAVTSSHPEALTGTLGLTKTEEVQDGCTVEGGYSSQRFNSTNILTEDTYVSIRLFIQGVERAPKEPVVNKAPRTYTEEELAAAVRIAIEALRESKIH